MTDAVNTPPTDTQGCPFCGTAQIASEVTMHIASGGNEVMTFEPLNPVVPGHLLVVPTEHVEAATASPLLTAEVAEVAARVARQYVSANIITSIGGPATQTVRHLHLHVVPRVEGDGLALPWTARPVPTATHTDPAAQALRDAVWQQGANITRYKAAHSALTRDLGLDFSKTGGIVGRILSDLRRDVGADYERTVDFALAAQAPAPTPGQRTVQVVVYTDEPGPDVTEVEDGRAQAWSRRGGAWWFGSFERSWSELAALGPMYPAGTRARLRGDA